MNRPTCKICKVPADWLRTRSFEDGEHEVWECNTLGCASRGLIICHTHEPKRCPACRAHADLMCGLGLPENVVPCDHILPSTDATIRS